MLVPSGVLGLGFEAEALRRGLAAKPDIICIDGGSTDSGPFYLGSGTSKYSRASTKSEWQVLMQARAEANVPLVVGSAGTCGTDSMVNWMFEITSEIAKELGQKLSVATVKSSQSPEQVVKAWQAGNLDPLANAPELTETEIEGCNNIVALAGVEQILAALETGAEIVVAGRTTDTAVIAALPIQNGEHPGAAWHGAKIAECGALCTTHPMSGVVLVEFDDTGFAVEPMAKNARCTPRSVSAHMLYENANPFVLPEPGGFLDVTEAKYMELSDRCVRVTGSSWTSSEQYTVKLEGAGTGGYRAMMIAILRDQRYVKNSQAWSERLVAFLRSEIASRLKCSPDSFDIEIRLVGVNAALGDLETRTGTPAEIGAMFLASAETQALANEIAKIANPFLLHFPLTDNEELPTFAFPFSPAEVELGRQYEFCINHTMVLDKPMDAFKLDVIRV